MSIPNALTRIGISEEQEIVVGIMAGSIVLVSIMLFFFGIWAGGKTSARDVVKKNAAPRNGKKGGTLWDAKR